MCRRSSKEPREACDEIQVHTVLAKFLRRKRRTLYLVIQFGCWHVLCGARGFGSSKAIARGKDISHFCQRCRMYQNKTRLSQLFDVIILSRETDVLTRPPFLLQAGLPCSPQILAHYWNPKPAKSATPHGHDKVDSN